jgi:transketolase
MSSVTPHTLPIAIEADLRQCGHRLIATEGTFIGTKGFGTGALGKVLYQKFCITAKAAMTAAMK